MVDIKGYNTIMCDNDTYKLEVSMRRVRERVMRSLLLLGDEC